MIELLHSHVRGVAAPCRRWDRIFILGVHKENDLARAVRDKA